MKEKEKPFHKTFKVWVTKQEVKEFKSKAALSDRDMGEILRDCIVNYKPVHQQQKAA